MFSILSRVSDGVARRWCYLMHPEPMWPICGMYQCPRCLRKYPVPWEKKDAAKAVHAPKDSKLVLATVEVCTLTAHLPPGPHAV